MHRRAHFGSVRSAEQDAVHARPVADLDCARFELQLGTAKKTFPAATSEGQAGVDGASYGRTHQNGSRNAVGLGHVCGCDESVAGW